MKANMEFFLVSGHGYTETNQLMVVPENTFLMFLGESSFDRFATDNIDKLSKLVSYKGYMEDGRTLKPAAKEAFYTELFQSFITGESNALKFYTNAAIYCPGDILPDSRVDFRSPEEIILSKGVYSLPVPELEYQNFVSVVRQLYELSRLVKVGIGGTEVITATLKDEKREEFLHFQDIPYNEWHDSYEGYFPTLDEYFRDTAPIQEFLDTYYYHHRNGNLGELAGIPITGDYLSEIIPKIHEKGKRYRFFIFSGCRGSIGPPGPMDLEIRNAMSGRPPTNFPNNLSNLYKRKFHRRASLSSKCATKSKKPAMNILEVRDMFFRVLEEKGVKDRLKVIRNKNYDSPEYDITANVFDLLKNRIFKGEGHALPKHMGTWEFSVLVTYGFVEGLPDIPGLTEFTKAIRDSFGDFARLMRREAPFKTERLTMEGVLLQYMGYSGLVRPVFTKYVNMNASLAGESKYEAEHEGGRRRRTRRLRRRRV